MSKTKMISNLQHISTQESFSQTVAPFLNVPLYFSTAQSHEFKSAIHKKTDIQYHSFQYRILATIDNMIQHKCFTRQLLFYLSLFDKMIRSNSFMTPEWLYWLDFYTNLTLYCISGEKDEEYQERYPDSFCNFVYTHTDDINDHIKELHKFKADLYHWEKRIYDDILKTASDNPDLMTLDRLILQNYNRDLDLKRIPCLLTLKSIVHKEYTLQTNPCADGKNHYRLCNPSLHHDIAILRGVNYTRHGDYFDIYHPQRHIQTQNYLIQLDDMGKIQNHRILQWNANAPLYPCNINGIEDIRLIDDQWFTGTMLEITPVCRPTLCLFQYDASTASVKKVHILKGLTEGRAEKNWLPFYHNQELLAIYNHRPFTILKIDKDTGSTSIYKQKEYNLDLCQFRGSAPPVAYNLNGEDGYLYSIHEVCYNGVHQYWNRLVWMNLDLEIQSFSLPFRMNQGEQIEMLTSIRINDELVELWCGIRDAKVIRYDFSHEQIHDLLIIQNE